MHALRPRILDGKVPYAMVMGNHDCSRPAKGSTDRDTPMNRYFPVSHFRGQPTFGGVMKEGRIENAYYLFSAGGPTGLIVTLESAPRNEVVAWANAVCQVSPPQGYPGDARLHVRRQHPLRFCPEVQGAVLESAPYRRTVNDGEELWNKLVRRHDFAFTFNGHVPGRVRVPLQQERPRQDHAADAGELPDAAAGGEGFLRLVEILPDGKTVHVKIVLAAVRQVPERRRQPVQLRVGSLRAAADSVAPGGIWHSPLSSGIITEEGDCLRPKRRIVRLGANWIRPGS